MNIRKTLPNLLTISASKQFQNILKYVDEKEEISVSKLIRKVCVRYFIENNFISNNEAISLL